jgi:hypothetical protein
VRIARDACRPRVVQRSPDEARGQRDALSELSVHLFGAPTHLVRAGYRPVAVPSVSTQAT